MIPLASRLESKASLYCSEGLRFLPVCRGRHGETMGCRVKTYWAPSNTKMMKLHDLHGKEDDNLFHHLTQISNEMARARQGPYLAKGKIRTYRLDLSCETAPKSFSAHKCRCRGLHLVMSTRLSCLCFCFVLGFVPIMKNLGERID